MSFLSSYKKIDWLLFSAVLFLNLFGLAAIFSLDRGQGLVAYPFLKKQLIAVAIGIFLVAITMRIQYTLFRSVSTILYIASLVLLIGVLIFGHTIRGTRGWFVVGGFSFQPVEFAKVALIIHLAHFFARYRDHFRTWWSLVGSGIIVLIPVTLVLFQPDAGSALLLIATWIVMLLVAGVRRVHVTFFTMVSIIFVIVAWFFLFAPYQKDRIRTFFDPTGDPLGRGYNVSQSIIAVGSGGIAGKGLGAGSQSQLRFLPEARTDFIFASLGEELGFIGVGTILTLLAIIWYRIMILTRTTPDDFGIFMVMGFLTVHTLQSFINIGMNIGVLPVTGIVLPFVSYGGSAIIFTYFLLGIILSISSSSRVGEMMVIE